MFKKGAIEIQKDYDNFRRKSIYRTLPIEEARNLVKAIEQNPQLYAEKIAREDSLPGKLPEVGITWIKNGILFQDSRNKIPVIAQVRYTYHTKTIGKPLNLRILLPTLVGVLIIICMLGTSHIVGKINEVQAMQADCTWIMDNNLRPMGVRLSHGETFYYTSEGNLPPIKTELLPVEWEYIHHPDLYCTVERAQGEPI
jgi:hypothetical protein